jgi:hypothetical protein
MSADAVASMLHHAADLMVSAQPSESLSGTIGKRAVDQGRGFHVHFIDLNFDLFQF